MTRLLNNPRTPRRVMDLFDIVLYYDNG
jgi:hypothetical protein